MPPPTDQDIARAVAQGQPVSASTVPLGPNEAPAAHRLGRYLLIELLGRGGMGAVYSAYDPELDRRIAIKVLPLGSDGEGQGEARSRLLREAQAMAQLAHPNVVPVYDVGAVGDVLFFAMERVDGGTLRSWMARAHAWREVLAVFTQAGRGLAAAHAAGIIHRDFKPENVLIGKDGRVRVGDFGVARAAQDAGNVAEAPATTSPGPAHLTRIGSVVGTPGYLAPEQLDGNVSVLSDQFAFCLTLFEALTGTLPFQRSNLAAYAQQLRQDRVEFPASSPVPRFVREVVLRGLEKAPARRFASMEALLEALGRDPRARRIRLAAGTALVTSLALAGGGALLLRVRHQQACSDQSEQVAQSWQRQREAVRASFAASKLPFAADAFLSLNGVQERIAQEWREARRAVCLKRAPLPAALLPAATACLDQAAQTMDQATQLLARGNQTIIQYALPMTAALPSVRACLDADALGGSAAPPPDKAVAVAAARAELSRAEILAIPDATQGVAAVQKTIGPLERLQHTPTLAQALFVLGDAQLRADQRKDSAVSLQRSAELALQGRDDRLFVKAASRLAYLFGVLIDEPARSADWMQLARRAFDRVGRPEVLGAWLDVQQIGMAVSGKRWRECADVAARAAEASRHQAHHHNESEALFMRAYCLEFFAPPVEVEQAIEQSYRNYLRWVGPRHADTADAVGTLALAHWYRGDSQGGLPLIEESIRILKAHPPSVQMPMAHETLARILSDLGREREALAARQKGLELLAKVPHRRHTPTWLLAGLASSERKLGMKAEAFRHAQQAIGLCSEELDRDMPFICAPTHFIYAQVLLDRGDRGEARRQAALAREGHRTPSAHRQREQVNAWAREVHLDQLAVDR